MHETWQKPTIIQMWPIWKMEFVVFLCSQGLYKVNAAKKWCCSRAGVYCWILVVYERVTHLICFPEALQFQLENQNVLRNHMGVAPFIAPNLQKKGPNKTDDTNQRKTELSPTQAFVPILHWKVELYLTLGIWQHFENLRFLCFFSVEKKYWGRWDFFLGRYIFVWEL